MADLTGNFATNVAPPPPPKPVRAGPGEYHFDMVGGSGFDIGSDYSTANGSAFEGERMLVARVRLPAGTGAEAHSHPNEQWTYILEGVYHAVIGGVEVRAEPGTVLYMPADTLHSGRASSDGDVVFFTVKDTSYGVHGIRNRV